MTEIIIQILGYLYFALIYAVVLLGVPIGIIVCIVEIYRCITGKGELQEKYTYTIRVKFTENKKSDEIRNGNEDNKESEGNEKVNDARHGECHGNELL